MLLLSFENPASESVFLGVGEREGKCLKLSFEFAHAQAVGNRRVDF